MRQKTEVEQKPVSKGQITLKKISEFSSDGQNLNQNQETSFVELSEKQSKITHELTVDDDSSQEMVFEMPSGHKDANLDPKLTEQVAEISKIKFQLNEDQSEIIDFKTLTNSFEEESL